MTIARAHLIGPSITRWYHCVTRCVRRPFPLGEGENDRKVWIDNRQPSSALAYQRFFRRTTPSARRPGRNVIPSGRPSSHSWRCSWKPMPWTCGCGASWLSASRNRPLIGQGRGWQERKFKRLKSAAAWNPAPDEQAVLAGQLTKGEAE
jgi:hypothetical protein